MNSHPFHKQIGETISQSFEKFVILKDNACGGNNLLSLCYNENRYKSEFSEVDMILLKDNKVKVIFEIEESDVKPTQVCGKLLASALSKYCYSNNKKNDSGRTELDGSIMFVQILYKPKINENGNKFSQLSQLDRAIRDLLALNFTKIKKYKLYIFDYGDNFSKMVGDIQEFLES